MKHIAPTLTAIALMGAAPAFGASIADDLVIKPTAQIQVRAQFGAGGSDAAGNDYNIYNGAVGETEAVRFGVRRARMGLSAKNSTGWDAVLQIRGAEGKDSGAGTAGTVPAVNGKADRNFELYYANVGKTFMTDTIAHRIHIGLDKPFNGESSISSSTYMFPTDRAGAKGIEFRQVGVGYLLTHDFIKFGFDVMNNGNGGDVWPKSGTGGTSTDGKNGVFYSARVEFAPGADWMPKKKMESFAGAEGKGVVIGLDYMNCNKAMYNTNGSTRTVSKFGPDALVHFNGISGMIEYKASKTTEDNKAGASADDINGTLFDILLGYAIPMEQGFAIEPAIRFAKVDNNKDADGPTVPYASGEWNYDTAGSQFDIGVNFYWNGHANKTQLAYTNWTGEEPTTGDKAKAHVFTLQQQVTF